MNKSDLPRIGALLVSTGERVTSTGSDTWDLLHDWMRGPQQPAAPGERGGGMEGVESDAETARDRLEDRRAARWWAEYVDLLSNLEAPLRRLNKLHDLATVEDRRRRNHDGTFDPVLAAEAAQAGFCASCWRLDQQLVEIETDKHGHRYYRDWCRPCGSFKAEHGMLPTLDLLRIRQRREWNTADVTAALIKANRRKAS